MYVENPHVLVHVHLLMRAEALNNIRDVIVPGTIGKLFEDPNIWGCWWKLVQQLISNLVCNQLTGLTIYIHLANY